MAQMYDHFVYKTVENYDLSLNMSEHSPDGYMSADHTFHTPSFGDEEFEIPPLNLPTSSDGENCNVYNHQALNHHDAENDMEPPACSQNMCSGVMTPTTTHSMAMLEPQYPHHRPQNIYVGQMTTNDQESSVGPHPLHVQIQAYENHPGYNGGAPIQSQSHMQPPHLHMMHQPPQHHMHPSSTVVSGHSPMLTSITQSQLNGQMGAQISPMSGTGSMGSSPPGSTHTSPGLETSEDSDDSTPLTQLIGGIKRPSPEPIDSTINRVTVVHKKPKVQKKKKKRDPNEPQKPVSAYALFFRDTQAAIKGQNPNASFGEVSKIVASMWDSLDADHKNLYKKKTEAAKKEYLKALAAYRASLVSKQAAADQSDVMYGNSVSPTTTTASPSNSSPGHAPMLSPLQKKSPLLTSLMEGNAALAVSQLQPQQHQMPGMWRSMNNMYFTVPQQSINGTHHMSHHPMGQMLHSQPTQMMQQSQMLQSQGVSQSMNTNTSYTVMSSIPSQHGMPGSEGAMSQNCVRNNLDTTQWDQNYPSNDCVITHCSRDAFNSWLEPRPPQNTYASVK